MRKKLILVCVSVALAVAGLSIFINANSNSVVSLSLLEQNLEVLARGESPFCYNGGEGSSSCSIDGGLDIAGYGVTAGCSVSCQDSYYACCTLRCRCVKES